MIKQTIGINETIAVVVYENGFFLTQHGEAVAPADIGYRTDSSEYKDIIGKVIETLEGFNTTRARKEIRAIKATQNKM